MALIGSVPRRCVNLPPGSLRTLVSSVLGKKVQQGPAIEEFYTKFAQWLGVPHVWGAASGRSAFQLALEALGLEEGAEIIFSGVYLSGDPPGCETARLSTCILRC